MCKQYCHLKKRHLQSILLCACFFCAYMLRINMSVAIVAMTDKNSSNANFQEFNWTEKEKSAVLSSFFWGYLITQAPSGFLGHYFSPKLLLTVTNFISAILTALTPLAANHGGWQLLCAFRAGQGLCQGFVMPLTFSLAAKWAPPNESSRFVGIALSGASLGAAAGLPISGTLAASSIGWPSIFYVTASFATCWTLIWAWAGADSPSTHSTITPSELDFIESSIKHSGNPAAKLKIPWREIFTSVPYLTVIVASISTGFTYYMLLTEIPSYINSILKYNVKKNGLLSSIPYFSLWICTSLIAWLADYLQEKQIISMSLQRKIWTTFCTTGSGLALVLIAFAAGQNTLAVIITFTISVSVHGFAFSGFLMNHIDLAPNFSGLLAGIGNAFETVTAILAPLAVGFIVENPKSIDQWKIVFVLAACVDVFGNLIYIRYISVDQQPWNTPVE